MPRQLDAVVEDAFCGLPDVLTLKIGHGLYSAMLPDHGVTFEVRPPLMLVACFLIQSGVDVEDIPYEDHRYRVRSAEALGYALAHFDELEAGKQEWLQERFMLHLGEARAAGEEFWRVQLLQAGRLEAEFLPRPQDDG